MPATLAVPETIFDAVRAFVEAEAIPLSVTVGDDGTVRVAQSEHGQESTASVLQAGGRITCAVARKTAGKLGLKLQYMGKLLNHLDIKVRACELGCFQ